MRTQSLRLLIYILLLVLLLALMLAFHVSKQDPEDPIPSTPAQTQSTGSSQNTQSSSSPTTSDPTQSDPAPSQSEPTTPDPTPSGNPSDGDYIGALYTREQLEAMDSTLQGYGAGKDVDSKNRPLIAQSLHNKYKKYNANFIGEDNGKIYLTFNCSYEYEGLVAKTLDILKEKNVQCVFFVDRYFLLTYPDLIQRIFDEGHILANHCTTHPDLPNLSIDEIVSQIMTIHDIVKETYGYEMTLFRPPSGYYSEQVLAIAQSLGYSTYNWSYTYLDWDRENQPDPETTKQAVIKAAHSGAIYQLHAISSTNAAILGDVIDAIRAKGLEFALLP